MILAIAFIVLIFCGHSTTAIKGFWNFRLKSFYFSVKHGTKTYGEKK